MGAPSYMRSVVDRNVVIRRIHVLLQPPVKWVPGLSPGVKCGRGVLLTTHHLLVLQSWKNRAILLPTLWATPGM